MSRRGILAVAARATSALVAVMFVATSLGPAPQVAGAVDTGGASAGTSQMVGEALGLEQTFVKLWNERKFDELKTAYYAPDAVLVPPNHEPIRGRDAIVDYFRGARDAFGEIEGGTETWSASASGDIVSLVGKFSAHDGRVRVTSHELYGRQPDGTLKCTVDMFGFRDPLS